MAFWKFTGCIQSGFSTETRLYFFCLNCFIVVRVCLSFETRMLFIATLFLILVRQFILKLGVLMRIEYLVNDFFGFGAHIFFFSNWTYPIALSTSAMS